MLQKERKFSLFIFYNNLSYKPSLLGEGVVGSGGEEPLKLAKCVSDSYKENFSLDNSISSKWSDFKIYFLSPCSFTNMLPNYVCVLAEEGTYMIPCRVGVLYKRYKDVLSDPLFIVYLVI